MITYLFVFVVIYITTREIYIYIYSSGAQILWGFPLLCVLAYNCSANVLRRQRYATQLSRLNVTIPFLDCEYYRYIYLTKLKHLHCDRQAQPEGENGHFWAQDHRLWVLLETFVQRHSCICRHFHVSSSDATGDQTKNQCLVWGFLRKKLKQFYILHNFFYTHERKIDK